MSIPPRHLWRGGGRKAGDEVQNTNQAPKKPKKPATRAGFDASQINYSAGASHTALWEPNDAFKPSLVDVPVVHSDAWKPSFSSDMPLVIEQLRIILFCLTEFSSPGFPMISIVFSLHFNSTTRLVENVVETSTILELHLVFSDCVIASLSSNPP